MIDGGSGRQNITVHVNCDYMTQFVINNLLSIELS